LTPTQAPSDSEAPKKTVRSLAESSAMVGKPKEGKRDNVTSYKRKKRIWKVSNIGKVGGANCRSDEVSISLIESAM